MESRLKLQLSAQQETQQKEQASHADNADAALSDLLSRVQEVSVTLEALAQKQSADHLADSEAADAVAADLKSMQ